MLCIVWIYMCLLTSLFCFLFLFLSFLSSGLYYLWWLILKLVTHIADVFDTSPFHIENFGNFEQNHSNSCSKCDHVKFVEVHAWNSLKFMPEIHWNSCLKFVEIWKSYNSLLKFVQIRKNAIGNQPDKTP